MAARPRLPPTTAYRDLRDQSKCVEWLNGTLIIGDDYDSEFRFGGRSLEPLQALDTAGCVAYVGSFSKTMLPTLRLGFMVVPTALREAAHKAKYVSDWHTPILGQHALALAKLNAEWSGAKCKNRTFSRTNTIL